MTSVLVKAVQVVQEELIQESGRDRTDSLEAGTCRISSSFASSSLAKQRAMLFTRPVPQLRNALKSSRCLSLDLLAFSATA